MSFCLELRLHFSTMTKITLFSPNSDVQFYVETLVLFDTDHLSDTLVHLRPKSVQLTKPLRQNITFNIQSGKLWN